MYDLLERRRALLQRAAIEKEGGGENDGKYIIYRGSTGPTANPVTRSVDYGVSYVNIPVASMSGSIRGNVALDCNGILFSCPNTQERHRYYIPPDYTGSGKINFRSGSVSLYNTNVVGMNTSSIFFSSDGDSFLWLGKCSSGSMYCRMYKGTFFAGQSPSARKSTLTGVTASITLMYDPLVNLSSTWPINNTGTNGHNSGFYINANRDNLKYVIVGSDNQGNRTGYSPSTASFTSNGGKTWIPIQDLLYGSQSGQTPNQFRASSFSNNGKYCGIVYNNKLWISTNSCSNFSQKTVPDVIDFYNICCSQNWGVMYVVGRFMSASISRYGIWRSTDKGTNWERVFDGFYSGSYAFYPKIMCNDKGDKLIRVDVSGSAFNNRPLYYSHDYGTTWTSSGKSAGYPGISYIDFDMCRDSFNI